MYDEVETHEPPRWPPFLAVLLLLAAYPLSIGPMLWLCESGYVASDNRFWTAFYTPLAWIYETSPVCESWFDAYMELWVP